MAPKNELIAYIKYYDRYFQDIYIDDYPYEILLALKKIIASRLNELPKGYRLSSNGYNKELEEINNLQINEEATQF